MKYFQGTEVEIPVLGWRWRVRKTPINQAAQREREREKGPVESEVVIRAKLAGEAMRPAVLE